MRAQSLRTMVRLANAMVESIGDKKTWLKAMRHLKRCDNVMDGIIDGRGYIKIQIHDNYYGALIRSIIAQQISGSAAVSITNRLRAVFGGGFPTPEEFLSTNKRKISAAGVSPQKFSYIKDLSRRIVDGKVELRKFNSLPNERIIDELDKVKGIGRWTAEMFMMFSLGRTDILPMDDYGIRKAIKRKYGLKELPDKKKLALFEKRWRPYNSIASIYLWEDEGVKEPR